MAELYLKNANVVDVRSKTILEGQCLLVKDGKFAECAEIPADAQVIDCNWKKSTKWGGIISMAIGTLITISWEWQLQKSTGIQTVFVALPAALIALIIVSLATQNSKQEIA